MKLKTMTALLMVVGSLVGCSKSTADIQALRTEMILSDRAEGRVKYKDDNPWALNTQTRFYSLEELERYFIHSVEFSKVLFDKQLRGEVSADQQIMRCTFEFSRMGLDRDDVRDVCLILASGGHVEYNDYKDKLMEKLQPRIDDGRLTICESEMRR